MTPWYARYLIARSESPMVRAMCKDWLIDRAIAKRERKQAKGRGSA